MSKEQYKAANSKIFPVTMIILGYFLITFLLSIITGNSTWRVWIQIGFTASAILVDIFALIKNRETKACSVALMGSGALAYVVIVLLNSNVGVYTYVFALIVCSMAFLNVIFPHSDDARIHYRNPSADPLQRGKHDLHHRSSQRAGTD